ncbi:TIM barrel protein [uncultured Litoreibacter sp.]|uniref:TIM barrel protein n=2 Tax=uncultured Litoreibacter sp. TaxID=1392394 RepID=UPI00263827B6|nr:TIM barrel protein [uncultured Litoreibacter sp.]
MLPKALNHMTAPGLSFDGLLELAQATGCSGVELRTDLATPVFDGANPADASDAARAAGLDILTVAEIKSFNDWSDGKAEEANALMEIAAACGAKGVSLIPRNDGHGLGNGERQANLRIALRELKPLLEAHDLMGFVEPLGFEHCSMQYKSEAVEIIEALRAKDRIMLIHDTFHHFLAGGGPVFPDHTAIVHVSGVVDPDLAILEMADPHRVLVDGRDRLGNVTQVEQLIAGGYVGAVSIEAFAPDVHKLSDPKSEILRSFGFIESRLAEMAA